MRRGLRSSCTRCSPGVSGRRARFAVGTGRLLVEDDRPVLVGAVVGQTRDAPYATPRRATSSSRRRSAARRRCARARRRRAPARCPAGSTSARRSVPPRCRSLARSSMPSERRSTASSRRAARSTWSSSVTRASARAVSSPPSLKDVPAVVLEAACIPYGEGISFLPLRELARPRCSAGREDSRARGADERGRGARRPRARCSSIFTASRARRGRPRRRALGRAHLPRPRGVRRTGGGRPAARRLRDAAGAPRAAPGLGRDCDHACVP